MKKLNKPSSRCEHRLTISLTSDQRNILETIADANRTSLAFIVRFALEEFTTRHQDKAVPFSFAHLGKS